MLGLKAKSNGMCLTVCFAPISVIHSTANIARKRMLVQLYTNALVRSTPVVRQTTFMVESGRPFLRPNTISVSK